MTLDWVIVGGGLHGVHIAVRLLQDGGVASERLAIVDPGPRLLDRWRTRAAATGMEYLRSPVMHHLDGPPYALLGFAYERFGGRPGLFTKPNDRPSLELFNTHCDHVIERLGLDRRHVEDRVEGIEVDESAVWLRMASGRDLQARRVVLALGANERVAVPDWAPPDHPRIRHVYDPQLGDWRPEGPLVGVIGGGISAAQVALRLLRDGHRVVMISRHELRMRQYDSDPGWHGPKYMVDYSRIEDPAVRRAQIAGGRNKGSMPSDVRRALRRAVQRGLVTLHESGVESFEDAGDALRLRLVDGTRVEVHDLLLAIGFRSERPGGAMLDRLIEEESLPCAPCGYPIVDSALRWHPRIHVAGPLAEIELGPVAGNISGARRAGERILSSVAESAGRAGATSGRTRAAIDPRDGLAPRLVPWGDRRRAT